LLLPGLDGTGRLFDPLLEALPPELQGLVVPYPPNEVWGYDELCAHVRATLPSEAPYVLLGESFSGPITIRLAAEQPQGLVGLILAASFVQSPLGSYGALNRLLAALLWARPPRWAIRRYLAGPRADRELVDRAARAIGSVERRVVTHRGRAVLGVDVRAELGAVRVPVLYLQAQRDRLVGARALRRVQDRCPDLRRETLDAPHLLLQSRPAEAAQAISRFCEACTG
jgi:pimeloyl-[acyl-carrier protein] methyl ester esterase